MLARTQEILANLKPHDQKDMNYRVRNERMRQAENGIGPFAQTISTFNRLFDEMVEYRIFRDKRLRLLEQATEENRAERTLSVEWSERKFNQAVIAARNACIKMQKHQIKWYSQWQK